MSRAEMYPWSLLTEVGDYFCVTTETKPYVYMNQLVAQKNYRLAGTMKYDAVKVSYGTIVMLAQIGEELPPHEFVSQEGILASTSRRHLIESMAQKQPSAVGEKPIVAKRTQAQIVAAMHQDVRRANLPWWYDPKTGQLVVSNLVKEPELSLWYNKQFNPGAETPYPEHYNLDENLMKKTREQIMEEEEEEDWNEGDEPQLFGTGEDDVELDE